MKKQKPKKSPAQIAKEQAEKAAAKTAEWQRECRRLGIAARVSFIRAIKNAMECEPEQARAIFEQAVNAGEIEFVMLNSAGDVGFYRMKKNFPKSLEV